MKLSKNFVKGKFLDTNNDYGFVEISKDEEDIFIHGSKTNGAIDGDIVLQHERWSGNNSMEEDNEDY